MKNQTLPSSDLEFLDVNNGKSGFFTTPPRGILNIFSSDILLGEAAGVTTTLGQSLGVRPEFRDGYGLFTLLLGPDAIAMGHIAWSEQSREEAWAEVTGIYDGVHRVVPSWFPPLEEPKSTRWMTFMAFPESFSIPKEIRGDIAATVLGLGFGMLDLQRSYLN